LELLRQRALGRELIAGPELALLEERLDLLDDALVEPAAPDGLDDGQFATSQRCWSGGLTRRPRGYDEPGGPSRARDRLQRAFSARGARRTHRSLDELGVAYALPSLA
jgi:hypothetical protein